MIKQMLFTLSLLFGVVASAGAENYPYRSDVLWVTVPDHSDWLYKTGEKAVVEVQFYKYGIPTDAVVEYSLADDMMEDDGRGTVKLSRGKALVNVGTRKTPGFRDLRLTATVDGKKYRHHIKVGFSVDKIRPFTKEPNDFMDFWKAGVDEIRAFPLTYTSELAKEYCTPKMDCYLIKLTLNKQGQAVYGYLFIPKNAAEGTCPAVLCPPGAGIKTIKEPLRHRYYGENGFIRLEMEIHGLHPSLSQETFNDISNAFNGHDNGYLENGIDNRDRYYMRRVYLSLVRSLDLLTSLPQWDGKNLAVQGGSQGGALSIVAAALDNRVTQCVVNHPALSDMAAYSAGVTGGYPHFNRIKGMFTPENIRTMAYYDVVNFARYVKADTYMTWGFNDDTCPPTTSYAVWNILTCPKEALITPINEHWTSDDTEFGQFEWIRAHLVK